MDFQKINKIIKFAKRFNKIQLKGKQQHYIKVNFYKGKLYFKHYSIKDDKMREEFSVICKQENETQAFENIFNYIESLKNEL